MQEQEQVMLDRDTAPRKHPSTSLSGKNNDGFLEPQRWVKGDRENVVKVFET